MDEIRYITKLCSKPLPVPLQLSPAVVSGKAAPPSASASSTAGYPCLIMCRMMMDANSAADLVLPMLLLRNVPIMYNNILHSKRFFCTEGNKCNFLRRYGKYMFKITSDSRNNGVMINLRVLIFRYRDCEVFLL